MAEANQTQEGKIASKVSADTVSRRNTTFPTDYVKGYNVSSLTYPENTRVNQDLQHWVSFYINVRASSGFKKESRVGFVNATADKDDIQNRAEFGNAGVGAKTVQVGAASAITGIALYEVAKRVAMSAGMESPGATRVGITGGALGVGLLAYGMASGQFKAEKTQRIADVITLAVQESPSVSYGVNWEIGELGTIGAMAGGGSQAALEEIKEQSNMASDVARRVAESVIALPGIFGSTNKIQSFIQASTKKVANPQREQLFKSVGFRQFTFTYKFMPASEKETGNVKDIINKFKFHMHPELSGSGIYYIYPSEFDIQYYYRGNENEYFNKISTCALTDMSVQYGGGEFSSFEDGAPTEITMILKFTELETLTKERIQDGY